MENPLQSVTIRYAIVLNRLSPLSPGSFLTRTDSFSIRQSFTQGEQKALLKYQAQVLCMPKKVDKTIILILLTIDTRLP